MAGMKIRFARIGNLASIRAKGAGLGALLFFLAVTVPADLLAQEKLDSARVSQPQSNPVPLPKNSNPGTGTATKATSGGKPTEALAGAITDVTIAPEDTKVTITVATDRLITPQEFLVEDPARLVLDFPNARNNVTFAQLPVRTASVKRIRIQQFQTVPTPIARLVLDLEEGYGTHEINTSKDSVRLVFYKAKPKPAGLNPAQAANVSPAPSAGPSKPKAPDANAPSLASESSTTKPSRAPEPVGKSSAIPTASAAPVDRTIPRPESLNKAAAPASDAKPKPAEPVAKNPAPAPAISMTASATPKQTAPARTELTKPAPVKDSKPAAAEPAVKASVSPALKGSESSLEPKPAPPKAELHKAAAVTADTRPQSTEAPAVAPLVAALTPASIARPSIVQSSGSRFSGQPLTLDLIDIPLVDFFRLMSEEGGINVVLDPEVKGRVSIKVVKVPWDQIFEAVLANNSLDKQVEGSVVRIARKATLQDEAKQQESLKKATLLAADLETRIKRLNYAKAASLIKALEDQKTVRGTIVIEERTNSLILTDLPQSITHMLQLIESLDIAQPQVEIEARIVSANRNFARDIGIQFGFVQGNLQRVTVGGPNTFGTIGGTRPSATPTSTYAAGTSTGRGASNSQASESASVSTGTSSNDKGNFNVNLPATKAFGGLGISIGNIFDTFLLDAAITAGESKGVAKLISQPKVTAQNNSPAIVTQGLRFPVQIVANNTIAIQFQNAALTLTVTPQITYEGNIVLDLKVENNSPDFALQVNGVPSIRTSESTTRVLVSDGGTTVIGGILTDSESTSTDKVPGLGSLPLVGHLFRRDSVSRETQEVLFFVTPRIIK
jgi:type IV pilus secretin PilQ/predicted competence protein